MSNQNNNLDPASIHAWLQKNNIKNEKGEPIEFLNHLFLYDIYRDPANQLVAMKGAQIGFSTMAILKNIYDSWSKRLEIIYTLSTDHDASAFVSSKVDRIIANNPILSQYVQTKDSVEQKAIGRSMIYFKGTWTKKAAITTTADRLVHDEKDSSKLEVIAEYQSRLQHSKHKQTHMFSHPSLPETGVHADWLKSDQKYWHITCQKCKYRQFLNWDTENPRKMSIDFKLREFICKKCGGILDRKTRATGQWVARYPTRQISGYWIPLLIAPWITAGDIIDRYNDPRTTKEFFYTKVLGLPYADGTAKLLRHHFLQNLTNKPHAPTAEERVVIGIDTGLHLDYVIGNQCGLFYHGQAKDYDELDRHMQRWPQAIAVIDQGGDLIGSRKFYDKWRGRVYLCMLGGDRKTKELVDWKKKDEHGNAIADRNRMIQLVVDEFREQRIPVHGTEADWTDYWLDWNNLMKIKVLDEETNQVKGYKWIRNGRDHLALATVFWRVGMDRFPGRGFIYNPPSESSLLVPNSYMINPNGTVDVDIHKLMGGTKEEYDLGVKLVLDALEEDEYDWRD